MSVLSRVLQFFGNLVGRIFLPAILQAVNEGVGEFLRRAQQQKLLSNSSPDSPLDLFVLQNYLFFRTGHFSKNYEEWRMRRITKILEIFGVEFFRGKKILELGGGLGDIGAFFACLGADVVSAEYRAKNRNLASIRYRNIPNFKSVFCDAENDFTHLCKYIGGDENKFDLILCLGFLEVITNVNNVIDCCMMLSNDVIIETMVCDSTDANTLIYVDMPRDYNDHPSREQSARPSPAYIESLFIKKGWSCDRYFTSDLNTPVHKYDWVHKNDLSVDREYKEKQTMRRFWHFKCSGVHTQGSLDVHRGVTGKQSV